MIAPDPNSDLYCWHQRGVQDLEDVASILCLLLLRVCYTQITKWAVMGVLIVGGHVSPQPWWQ